MKNLILGILLSLFFTSPVFADEFEDLYNKADINEENTDISTEETVSEETDTESEEYLSKHFYTVEIIKGSQSAFDKFVPVTVRITPNETPVKTQITWDIPDDMNIHKQHSEFITSLVKGETYEFKVRVKPSEAGTYEITVNVTAWQHDSNYTSSGSTLITFGKNLIVDSKDSNYQISLALKILVIILSTAGAGFGIYTGWKKLTKTLKNYLKPPEL